MQVGDQNAPPSLAGRLAEAIVVPAVLAIVAIGFAGIVLRYAFDGRYSLFWAEEVIRYGFVWVFWLIAPLVMARGAAFAVDIVVEKLPRRLHLAVAVAGHILTLALLGIYIWQGVVMTRVNAGQMSTALEIPMSWVYAAIPFGSAALAIVVLLRTVRMVRTGRLPQAKPMEDVL